MSRPRGEAFALYEKIANRDRTIARLEAALKDKREALALEIMAHQRTLKAACGVAKLRQWIWDQRDRHGEELQALEPAFDLILNKIDEFATEEK